MSDSSEEDESQLPSGAECKERCDEFVKLTGTDSAMAMFYLQNCSWDLQCAVNFYFEKNGGEETSQDSTSDSKETTKNTPRRSQENNEINSSKKKKPRLSLEPQGLLQNAAISEDKRIRILSWNIDGLDTNNLKRRTKAVCQVIANENPHVIFLQEVVPESLVVLKKYCPDYRVSVSNDVGYFTVTLLKDSEVRTETEEVFPFFSSVMSRCLLLTECVIKDVPVLLINTHLESMAGHATERQRQLNIGFKKVLETDKKRTVIFGGDLNLREKELVNVGGIPNQVIDVWEATGKRPEAKFTWDTQRNDNKGFEGKFKPRCRFDRIYLRNAQPKALKPVYFELVGLERIPKCHRFASDHWGLLVHINIEA
ncbi:tyrosyl-DNA phosphodiesterase 2 [Octopus sinensis]|uniref:Tyrosyl-DNA phosphodiesterase 2 n=1 Tax=Octopus sinensis TaxID=2607531 RepID=A0A6P7TGR9_9MOLL|nr:tyrosyl-DNA phosphodiesterase 2 [Octopus sinensis]